jgi:hypothetical protein
MKMLRTELHGACQHTVFLVAELRQLAYVASERVGVRLDADSVCEDPGSPSNSAY